MEKKCIQAMQNLFKYPCILILNQGSPQIESTKLTVLSLNRSNYLSKAKNVLIQLVLELASENECSIL